MRELQLLINQSPLPVTWTALTAFTRMRQQTALWAIMGK